MIILDASTLSSRPKASHRRSKAKLSPSSRANVVSHDWTAKAISSTFELLEYKSTSPSEHKMSTGIALGPSEARSTCSTSAWLERYGGVRFLAKSLLTL